MKNFHSGILRVVPGSIIFNLCLVISLMRVPDCDDVLSPRFLMRHGASFGVCSKDAGISLYEEAGNVPLSRRLIFGILTSYRVSSSEKPSKSSANATVFPHKRKFSSIQRTLPAMLVPKETKSGSSSTVTHKSKTFFSPAKVNLFLRILGRRKVDGFHELSSVFHTISLGDFLTFSFMHDDSKLRTCIGSKIIGLQRIFMRALRDTVNSYKAAETSSSASKMETNNLTSCDGVFNDRKADTLTYESPYEGVKIPTDDSNLILRAIAIFRSYTGIKFPPVRVHLIKNVPPMAGLGGGSSNAATTLYAINCLTGKPLTEEQLSFLAAQLGSDVPFFFSYGSALCTGRGEEVKCIKPNLSQYLSTDNKLLILKLPLGLSTPKVYKGMALEECSRFPPELLLQCMLNGSEKRSFLDYSDEQGTAGNLSKLPNLENSKRNPTTVSTTLLRRSETAGFPFINDLEPPAFRIAPELKALKEYLLGVLRMPYVMMSGSGSSMFAIGKVDDTKIRKIIKDWDGIVCHQCNFITRPKGSWYEIDTPASKAES